MFADFGIYLPSNVSHVNNKSNLFQIDAFAREVGTCDDLNTVDIIVN